MKLESLYLFQNFSKEKLDEIKRVSNFKAYNKNDIVFYESEKSDELQILAKGSVKLYKTLPNGNEVFLHNLHAQCFVAEVANFRQIPYPATCKALNEVVMLKINFLKFKQKFFKDDEISWFLIQNLCEKVKILSDAFHQEVIFSSEEKVANFLINHEDIFLSQTRVKIASLLNLQPETLSRIIKIFKDKGYIFQDDKKITINKHKIIQDFNN